MSRSMIAAAALLVAVGCSHAQVKQEPVVQLNQTTPEATPVKELKVADAQPVEQRTPNVDPDKDARASLDRALAELRNVSVFFSYDSPMLSKDGEQKLAQVGQILAANPRLSVRVEGNCDERGTEDYNLALGQARADEARKYLMHMGAQTNQVKTLSYGDEHPKAQGHSEEAWQQNRRDDIVIAN